ncbi:MAG TPA: signal peptidase II [Anaerolineaceae bacterium]
MKKYIRDYAFLFGLAGVIILLDQVTKSYVRSHLGVGEFWSPWDWLTPYARFIRVHNTGAAFGSFQGMNNVFKVLAVVVALAIVYYFPQVPRSETALRIALGMQLGGAVGNLIDRFTQGYVTDFISVGTFPVWNIADSSVTVGVGVLLLGIWLQERHEKKAAAAAAARAEEDENEPDPAADQEQAL